MYYEDTHTNDLKIIQYVYKMELHIMWNNLHLTNKSKHDLRRKFLLMIIIS